MKNQTNTSGYGLLVKSPELDMMLTIMDAIFIELKENKPELDVHGKWGVFYEAINEAWNKEDDSPVFTVTTFQTHQLALFIDGISRAILNDETVENKTYNDYFLKSSTKFLKDINDDLGFMTTKERIEYLNEHKNP